MRKIVLLFKRSPTKNDAVLHKYVISDHGHQLQLILDSKTRWSSMFLMLERFLLLLDSTRKALIDLKSPLVVSEDEAKVLEEVKNTLKPIKICIDKLCRRDANLFTADTILRFMLQKLKMQNTDLSKRLFGSLSVRILERRNDMSNADVLEQSHESWTR